MSMYQQTVIANKKQTQVIKVKFTTKMGNFLYLHKNLLR